MTLHVQDASVDRNSYGKVEKGARRGHGVGVVLVVQPEVGVSITTFPISDHLKWTRTGTRLSLDLKNVIEG